WSGDHCVDPKIVPGVIFSNRKIEKAKPHLNDMAPTVLKLFGVGIPGYMKGKPLFGDEAKAAPGAADVPGDEVKKRARAV
ncbi:MAG TPA: nucleotide pyrophosphatase, partial [Thermodesulfobacteriota bacterium]|nr:nucleotide pyrophosphatase [Thermodesulfobacteriota bacterium]